MFGLAILLSALLAVAWSVTPDFQGYALYFHGSGAIAAPTMVTLPNVDLVGGQLTMSAWVYPKTANSPIITLGNTNPRPNNLRLAIESGRIVAYLGHVVSSSSANIQTVQSSTAPVPLDTWSHVAVVVDTDRSVKFYYNGALVSTSTATGAILPGVRATNFLGFDGTRYFQGTLNDVRVYNSARSAAQLMQEYNLDPSLNTYSTEVAMYAPLNEGFVNVARVFGATNPPDALQTFELPAGVIYNGQWVKPDDVEMRLCCSTGDPHVRNFAHAAWESQRSGNFVFVKTSDDFFMAQVHQRPCPSPWTSAKCNAGLAMRFFGDTIVYMFDTIAGIHYLKINGVVQPHRTTPFQSPRGIVMSWSADAMSMVITVPFVGSFSIWTCSCGYSNVCFQGTAIGLDKVAPTDNDRHGPLSGICGSYTSSSSTFIPACTTATAGCPPDLFSSVDRLDQFVDGEPIVYSDEKFQTEKPALFSSASTACSALIDRDACMFDVYVTGDLSMAHGYAMSEYRQCLEAATPGTTPSCTRPCLSNCNDRGTCTDGVCTCNTGFSGAACEYTHNFPCFRVTQGSEVTDITPLATPTDSTRLDEAFSRAVRMTDTVFFYLHRLGNSAEAPRVSLYVLADRAAKQGIRDGHVNIKITATGFPGTITTLPSGVAASLSGTGASLSWSDFGESGFAVIDLPVDITNDWNYDLTVSVTSHDGTINQVAFGTASPTNALDVFLLKPTNPAGDYSFILTGERCEDFCSDIKSCSACLAETKCGWCTTTLSCTLGRATGPLRGFCPKWRWDADDTVSRVLTTSFGYPVSPFESEVYLSGSDNDLPVPVTVDITNPSDFVFDTIMVFDQGSSMSDDIMSFQRDWLSLYNLLSVKYSTMALSIGAFINFPTPTTEYAFGFRLLKERTELRLSNYPIIQNIFNTMRTFNGGSQRSQLYALNQLVAMKNNIGLRRNSRRVAIVYTDSEFAEGTGSIPTRDDVRTKLISEAITPIFLTTKPAYYQSFVDYLGFGGVITLASDSSNFISATMEAIDLAARQVSLIATTVGHVHTAAITSSYIDGLSLGTRARFNVPMKLDAALDVDAVSVLTSPGFGVARIQNKPWEDIVPIATPLTPVSGDEDTELVISLDGKNPYWGGFNSLKARVHTVPTADKGAIYQIDPVTGLRGAQITSAPTDVQDLLRRIIFLPATNVNGVNLFTFEYSVFDDCVESLRASVQIDIQAVNDKPIAILEQQATDEDTPLTIDFSTSFFDVDNVLAQQTFTITSFVTSGGQLFQGSSEITSFPFTITASDHKITYRPPANRNRNIEFDSEGSSRMPVTDSFTYQIADPFESSTPATRLITVRPVNDAPQARVAAGYSATGDVASVLCTEDLTCLINFAGYDLEDFEISPRITSVTLQPGAVLECIDPDSATGEYVDCSLLGGVVSGWNARLRTPLNDNSFVATGSDTGIYGTVEYVVNDRLLDSSNTITLNIVVQPVNDPPVPAQLGEVETVLEDNDFDFTLEGSDPENDDYTVEITTYLPTKSKGTLFAVTFDTEGKEVLQEIPRSTEYATKPLVLTTKTLKFRPESNDYGDEYLSMTYRYNDGKDLSLDTALRVDVLPVNDPPMVYLYESLRPSEDANNADFGVFEPITDAAGNAIGESRSRNTNAVLLESGAALTLTDGDTDSLSVSDNDGDGVDLTITISATAGTLDADVSSVSGAVKTDQSITFTAPAAIADSVLRTLQYTAPVVDSASEQTITIDASDRATYGLCDLPSTRVLECERVDRVNIPIKISPLPTATSSPLTGAVIGGAAAAAVVAAVGYRLLRKKSEEQEVKSPWIEEGMDVAVANPMYQDRGFSGDNPFFEGQK